jgi:hypothetical protein
VSEAELQRWVVESCGEAVDLANAGVRNGSLKGQVVSGAERKQRIDECIAGVNRPSGN